MFLIIISVIIVAFLLQIKRFLQDINFCQSTKKLEGKTVLITGGNSGIGFETALDLANRGARIIIASENYDDCISAVLDIIKKTSNKNIVAKFLNLADFKSVRTLAEDILENEKSLDILINNAGTLQNMDKMTKDGPPWVLQVNYFGHFLLTYLLIDVLKKSSPSKIINISSSMYRFGFLDFKAIDKLSKYLPNFFYYCNSKLLILYATWAFAEKLKKFGITVNCIHPGIVRSNIFFKKPNDFGTKVAQNLIYYYLHPWSLTLQEGAQTTIHCAVCEKSDNFTGQYFQNCKVSTTTVEKDGAKIQKVWDQSLELVGLQNDEIKF